MKGEVHSTVHSWALQAFTDIEHSVSIIESITQEKLIEKEKLITGKAKENKKETCDNSGPVCVTTEDGSIKLLKLEDLI